MKKVRVLNCNRCAHEWAARKDAEPKSCPHCHSPYWNKPRVRKTRKD